MYCFQLTILHHFGKICNNLKILKFRSELTSLYIKCYLYIAKKVLLDRLG